MMHVLARHLAGATDAGKGHTGDHMHGVLSDILDDVADVGVDLMSPIETGLRGGVTLAEAKARVGGRGYLKSNLDGMAYRAHASLGEVNAAARDRIVQATAAGGDTLSGTDAGT
jgi:hypothetical protein